MVYAIFTLPGYLRESQKKIEQKMEKHTIQLDGEPADDEEDTVKEPDEKLVETNDETPTSEFKKDV